MIDNISNKVKFIALLIAIPLFLILAYAKIWSKVFSASSALKDIKSEEIRAERNRKELANLNNELNILDGVIGKDVEDKDIVQQEIFDIFSKMPSKVNFEKFYESHSFKNDYYSIITNSVLLSGNFRELLEASYFYEKEFKYSKVVSISYFTKKNYQTKRKKLYTKLIFQNYEKR